MARSRKKRAPQESKGPEHPFIEGTPLDEHGLPEDGAEVPVEDTDHVPVDSESSRNAAEFTNAVSRKGRGEKGVPFNAPAALKYNGMVLAQPQSRVRIVQTSPKRNDNIEEQPVAHLKDYELLRRYVHDNYWNGEEAVFLWEMHGGKYNYASGTLNFREDEMRRYGQQQQPPPYGAPPQYGMQPPPYGAPPAYGMPPPYGMQPYPQQPYPQQPYPQQPYPQPQQPGPQQPQAQQPPPPPPQAALPPVQIPAGTDPLVAMMMQMLMQQLETSRAELAQLRAERWQMQQGYAQPTYQQVPAAPGAGAAATATTAPATPKGPLEQLSEMSAMVRQMNNIRNDIAHEFSGSDGQETPEPTTPAPLNDADFPLMVKDFGAARAVATKDGEVSFPFFANIDKYESILDGVVGKVTKALDKITDKRTQSMREQVEIMERAEAVASRAGIGGRAPQQQALPQHQPAQNHQPANWTQPTPPPAKRQAEHPWNKFAGELAADRVEVRVRPEREQKPPEPEEQETASQAPEPQQNPPERVQVVETAAEVADVAAFEAPRG